MGIVFDSEKHPFVHKAHNYALEVLSGKIPACIYIKGACQRFLKDLEPNDKWYFDVEKAERYLRVVQNFEHASGQWKTKNIVYEPWQHFVWANIIGFINKETGFRRFRIAYIEIPRGQGKALSLDTKIFTANRGWINFGDIRIGDKVYARNGLPCNVTGKTEVHLPKKSYQMALSTGERIKCSDEHLWFTSTKPEREIRRKPHLPKEGIRTTEQIKETLFTGGVRQDKFHQIRMTEPLNGSKRLKNAYFWGLWLGSGKRNSPSILIHSDFLQEIKLLLKEDRIVISGEYQITEKRYLLIARGIRDERRHFVKNLKKYISSDILNVCYQDRILFFRGLMDAKGASYGTANQGTFGSQNWELINSFMKLACSLGFKPTLTVRDVRQAIEKTWRTGDYYTVNITAGCPIFRVPSIVSKSTKHIRPTQYGRYISEVYQIEDTPMQCIEVDSEDRSYLIGESFIPTHNSAMASQCTLYFLALDNPVGNMIHCFATRKEQARIVLDAAREMARKSQSYLKATGTKVLAHSIVHPSSGSKITALSSDHSGLDGLNAVLAVLDELHQMTANTFNVVYSGMSKRKDSLTLCITTAGDNTDSIGFSQSAYAKKVAIGEVQDEQYFSAIYTIDEGDDIFDEKTWRKANPGYGISVDEVTFRAKAEKAKITPSDIPNFKIKHLDIWDTSFTSFFSTAKWDECTYEGLNIDSFIGQSCYVAVDMASKVDLSSVSIMFKKDGRYFHFNRAYLPEDTVKQVNSPLYMDSIARGDLIVTTGAAIHYPKIKQDILDLKKKFKIIEVMYDPWNAMEMAQSLAAEGLETVEFRMNTSNLSEPTKTLDALMRKREICHNGSPLVRFCIGNVVCKEDAAGNVFPRKLSEKLKIDCAISMIMALAPYLQKEQIGSVYEQRGVRSI